MPDGTADERKHRIALRSAVGHDLARRIGMGPETAGRLLERGWTPPEIRRAMELAEMRRVKFPYIVRLANIGATLPVIEDILEIRSEYPNLSGPALFRCWELCMPPDAEEPDRQFLRSFLDAADDLIAVAESTLTSAVARSTGFVLGRLLEYVEATGRDFERVYQELLTSPEALLDRILAESTRSLDHGTEPRVRRGTAWDADEDEDSLADMEDKGRDVQNG